MITRLVAADTHDRILYTDLYGRKSLQRVNQRQCTGFIRILYYSRALEWVNICQFFHTALSVFPFAYLCPILEGITFAWSYNEALVATLYKPAAVFKKFSFANLLDNSLSCACTQAKRLLGFYDPLTANEISSFSPAGLHVRTMDLRIIQHKQLRQALSQGLNHIPLRTTDIAQTVKTVMGAFDQLTLILGLDQDNHHVLEARQYVHSSCVSILKAASRTNKYGFRYSGPYLFDILAVKNEVQWLLQHVYCSGLDKASNNACFMCIKHIRLMALERLICNDFLPCKSRLLWKLIIHSYT